MTCPTSEQNNTNLTRAESSHFYLPSREMNISVLQDLWSWRFDLTALSFHKTPTVLKQHSHQLSTVKEMVPPHSLIPGLQIIFASQQSPSDENHDRRLENHQYGKQTCIHLKQHSTFFLEYILKPWRQQPWRNPKLFLVSHGRHLLMLKDLVWRVKQHIKLQSICSKPPSQ